MNTSKFPTISKKDVFSEELRAELENCRLRMTSMEIRLTSGELRMASMEENINASARETIAIGDKVDDLQQQLESVKMLIAGIGEPIKEFTDTMNTAKAGLKVLGWLGVFAKWVTAIAGGITAVVAMWYAVTHIGLPPKLP